MVQEEIVKIDTFLRSKMHGFYVQREQQKQARMNRKNNQARDWYRFVYRLDEMVHALMLSQGCVHS